MFIQNQRQAQGSQLAFLLWQLQSAKEKQEKCNIVCERCNREVSRNVFYPNSVSQDLVSGRFLWTESANLYSGELRKPVFDSSERKTWRPIGWWLRKESINCSSGVPNEGSATRGVDGGWWPLTGLKMPWISGVSEEKWLFVLISEINWLRCGS